MFSFSMIKLQIKEQKRSLELWDFHICTMTKNQMNDVSPSFWSILTSETLKKYTPYRTIVNNSTLFVICVNTYNWKKQQLHLCSFECLASCTKTAISQQNAAKERLKEHETEWRDRHKSSQIHSHIYKYAVNEGEKELSYSISISVWVRTITISDASEA